MINTIIFDIGNVLMKFDSMPYLKKNFKKEEDIKPVLEAIFATHYWDELDLGMNPKEVFPKMYAAAPDHKEEIETFLNNVDKCLDKTDYAIPWIEDLKARGYQVLYLSNYSEFVMGCKPEVLDFLPLMDGGIFSCYVGMIKPNPAIFQKICDKYNLDPSTCIFIDDTNVNIEAAAAFGMHTVHFKDYKISKTELEEKLEKDKEETKKAAKDKAESKYAVKDKEESKKAAKDSKIG